MTHRLAGLNIYPIKAARGIALEDSDVDEYDDVWPSIVGCLGEDG